MKRRVRRAFGRWRTGDTEAVIVLTRNEWRQMRPSRHPIVLGVWVAFLVVSAGQLLHGISPASVNVNLAHVVQSSLAALVIAGIIPNLIAPWLRGDKASVGVELGGIILCCTAFVVYAGIIATTLPQWYTTAGFAWSSGMLAGTAGRAVQIFRRGW